MTKGSIKSGFALVILLGVAGSGKTLFRHLVLGLPVPEFSPSTPLAETSIRSMFNSRIAVDDGGDKWITVESEHMMNMVANEIKEIQHFPKSSNEGVIPQNEVEQAEKTSNSLQQKYVTEDAQVPKEIEDLPDDSQPENTCTPSKLFSKEFLDGIKIDSHLMKNSSKPFPYKLMDINFIYLLDSGGQPPFREMLPHFVQQSSAIVLMQKLNESLGFRPTIRYRDKGGKVSEGFTSQLTNEQILCQYVQGIRSQQKCKVFVVGTHRDRESECIIEETREKKDKTLLEAFRPVIGEQMELYKLGDPDQLMFPVDCTSRGEDDKATAKEFRKRVILNCMGEKKKIPLPWFVFEELLQLLAQKMEVRVLSVSECCEAAKHKLMMSHEECKAALKYLGKLNIIFYRPNILSEVVIPNAQVILDKITELVHCSHALRTGDSSTDAVPSLMSSSEKVDFRDSGQVTSELLKKTFPSHYRDDLFTSADFLKLLEGLLIAGKLENGKYFIPSLLPDLPVEEVKKYRVLSSTKHPAPLTIYYPNIWVPVGIMPSLIVYLQNISKWTLSSSKSACLKHNCIQFSLPDGKPGSVVLIDSTKFLEVHVKQSIKVDPKLCTKIGQDIIAGLDEAHRSLHYEPPKAEVGFLCSGECGNKEIHLAILDPKREAWICSENENIGDSLTPTQRHWDEILKTAVESKCSFCKI